MVTELMTGQNHFFRAVRIAIAAAGAAPSAGAAADSARIDDDFRTAIWPVMQAFCLECHSDDKQKGDLSLEAFASGPRAIGGETGIRIWEDVAAQIREGEMPPDKADRQPTAEETAEILAWVDAFLESEALARAGDPGPVTLRRLSNAEFTYSVRDLTGIPSLDPAREFPADSAAGEGFTNVGDAMAMSPALLAKYLDAGKDIASHAILLPDGARFSAGTTRRDWTDEIVSDIRALYARHTSGAGDVSKLDQWNVPSPEQATENDGRVNLAHYFAMLWQKRDAIRTGTTEAGTAAASAGLNPQYARLIWKTLEADAQDEGASAILAGIRRQWNSASSEDEAAATVSTVRAWQDLLWKFQPVGHFGRVRRWQEPVELVTTAAPVRAELDAAEGSADIRLQITIGTAGDGPIGDEAVFRSARIERSGKPVILLRDAREAAAAFQSFIADQLAATPAYLTAIERHAGDITAAAAAAAETDLDPRVARAWMRFLGFGRGADRPSADSYLSERSPEDPSRPGVSGWGMAGTPDLSVVANASGETRLIPGELRAGRIAVHPRPERPVAVAWESPIRGKVSIAAHVRHVHPACGNGVRWRLEARPAEGDRHTLDSGDVDLGGAGSGEANVPISLGDMIVLEIDARDGSHVCDLTEIDLTITENAASSPRVWSLTGDCANSIGKGNPHPDSFGSARAWHFFSESKSAEPADISAPDGSLAARWQEAAAKGDVSSASELARHIADLAQTTDASQIPEPDRALRDLLRSPTGPLFSEFDVSSFAGGESANAADQQARFDEDGSLRLAPGRFEFPLPGDMFLGAVFLADASLAADGAASERGSIQVSVTPDLDAALNDISSLWPGKPVIALPDSPAADQWRGAADDFRSLFPAAMCHARIVPVDEVVTLLLFHREDDHLARLMLEDDERRRLDTLWRELRFVSHEPARLVVALEQLLEFATQDADPRVFEPLKKPIADDAAAFERELSAAAPRHVDAVIDLASRAFRRPLAPADESELRRLYGELRDADALEHDEAIRLMIARIFASPEFLYRIEEPALAGRQGPVTPWELAARLSYFLWSSVPDAELRAAAAVGSLSKPEPLISQTRRMLQDDRIGRLALEFGCQWLHIRNLHESDEKSARHFPEFTELRDSMREESQRFFADLFRRDGSVLSILECDHTFLDAALARHYGIPYDESDVGSQWRRVVGMRRLGRGGVLGHASILATQSGASRTSPVLRGAWISETLLGERLPRPPDNVPELPESVPAGLSERQLIEQHSSLPECAKCHQRIDPYGFALESFDAVGRRREVDSAGAPVETDAILPDGTHVTGFEDLRTYLVTTQRDAFLRQFCRKLLGYALGRRVLISDRPLIDEMMNNLTANNWQVSAAIETIVLSPQFREIRGTER